MLNKFIDNYINILDNIFNVYKKEINDKQIALILSGGIDSSIIAYFLNKHFNNKKIIFFTLAKENNDDFFYAQKISQHFNLPINFINFNDKLITNIKDKILKILNKNFLEINSINLSLATGFYFLFEKIKEQGISCVFTGQGPDILLAGYHKYKNTPLEKLNDEIKKDLKLLDIDIKRDNSIAKENNIKLFNPYLENFFVKFCLEIPSEYKINKINNEIYEKYLSRKVAEKINLPKEIILRHKKAFQYSTKIIKFI